MIQKIQDFEICYDQIPLPVFQKDLNGNITYINSSYRKLFSVSFDEIVGMNDANLFGETLAGKYHKDDNELISSYRSKKSISPKTYLEVIDYKDKTYKVKTSKSVIVDNEECIGIQGILWCYHGSGATCDFHHSIVSEINDLIYVHDLEGNILWVNEGSCLGLNIKESDSIFKIIKSNHHDFVRSLMADKNVAAQRFKLPILTARGERIFEISANIQKIDVYEDKRLVVIGIGRDVTDQSEQEERLRKSQADLANLEKLKTVHLIESFLTHGFKAAVNRATVSVDKCLAKISSNDLSKEKSIELLVQLRNDLSRSEGDIEKFLNKLKKGTADVENVCPRKALGEARNATRRADQLSVSRRPSEKEIGDYAVPTVRADSLLFVEGLANLWSNAKRHAKKKIVFGSKVLDSKTVMIWVNDDGDGFSESDMKILGDPVKLSEGNQFFPHPIGNGVGLINTCRVFAQQNIGIEFLQHGSNLQGACISLKALAVFEPENHDFAGLIRGAFEPIFDYKLEANFAKYERFFGSDLEIVSEYLTVSSNGIISTDRAWFHWVVFSVFSFFDDSKVSLHLKLRSPVLEIVPTDGAETFFAGVDALVEKLSLCPGITARLFESEESLRPAGCTLEFPT